MLWPLGEPHLHVLPDRSPLNRVIHMLPNMAATGDDNGVIKVMLLSLLYFAWFNISSIKLWDHRQLNAIRDYTHHFDFVSDFLWLEDKRQLIATRYSISSFLSNNE